MAKKMNKPTDVIVIGAGIIGVSCALQLAERGLSVTLLDRIPPCQGTSYGNAGVISPWGCVPQSMPGLWRKLPRWLIDPQGPVFVRASHIARFLPWAWRFFMAGRMDRIGPIGDAMFALSYQAPENYRTLLKGTNAVNLVRDSLYVFPFRQASDADLNQLDWQIRKAHNVPVSRIDAAELRRLEPAISKEFKAAILIHDQARALDPAGIGEAMAGKAERLGISFVQTEVSALEQASGGWSVICAGNQRHNASRVVLAAGVWSAGLLKPFGISLPLEAERGYHLLVREAGIQIHNSIMDTQNMCVASQMEAGVRIAGTAEFAGISPQPNYRRAYIFKKSLKSLFPEICLDYAQPWMGRRPSLPDSLPCLGPIDGLPGLFAAFGHNHYGLGQAPKTGQIIADCVTGQRPDTDLTPYRIDRF